MESRFSLLYWLAAILAAVGLWTLALGALASIAVGPVITCKEPPPLDTTRAWVAFHPERSQGSDGNDAWSRSPVSRNPIPADEVWVAFYLEVDDCTPLDLTLLVSGADGYWRQRLIRCDDSEGYRGPPSELEPGKLEPRVLYEVPCDGERYSLMLSATHLQVNKGATELTSVELPAGKRLCVIFNDDVGRKCTAEPVVDPEQNGPEW
jgi:hypothetical protein